MTGDEATAAWLAAMWAEPPERFETEVEGAAIDCRGWNLTATDLPGLVLVHGFRAHGGWWDHIGPALAQDYRVIAPTLSGMGDSGRRERYTRTQYGRELLAAADAAGFTRPILVAHSFGALAALIAARAQPERVHRVVALDAVLPNEAQIFSQIPDLPLRTYPDREAAVSRMRLAPPGAWPIPQVLRRIAEQSVTQLPDGRWGWKFDNHGLRSLNEEPYRSALLGVTVPCDMIYGDRSELFTPERHATAREVLPHAGRFVSLPACHHHVMIEQPIALVAAIRSLLANEHD